MINNDPRSVGGLPGSRHGEKEVEFPPGRVTIHPVLHRLDHSAVQHVPDVLPGIVYPGPQTVGPEIGHRSIAEASA